MVFAEVWARNSLGWVRVPPWVASRAGVYDTAPMHACVFNLTVRHSSPGRMSPKTIDVSSSARMHICPRGGRHLEGLHYVAMPLRVVHCLSFDYSRRRCHPERRPTHPCSITTGLLAMGSDNDLRSLQCNRDRLHGEVVRLGIRGDSDRNDRGLRAL
jgi:hypothetical protein